MLLKGIAVVPVAGLVACREDASTSPTPVVANPTPSPATSPSTTLPPTASCTDDDDPTPAQTEGPYFTPNSPLRTSLLESGISGTRLTISGLVVQPPNGRILTTQLYFPGESRNASDGIFNSDLLVTVQSTGTPMQATFNFVVQV